MLGLVLNNQAIRQELRENQLLHQKIMFTPRRSPERARQGGQAGTAWSSYGGPALDSGKKAECYANQYIAFHMKEAAKDAGVEGATYATLGGEVSKAKTAVCDAKVAGKPTGFDARVRPSSAAS